MSSLLTTNKTKRILMNFTPKTWKELYNYYHPDGKVSTKYLRTLFSKAKGNRWDVVCTPNYIDIKCSSKFIF